MGRKKVKQPAELPVKLRKIRQKIGITQVELYGLLYPEKSRSARSNRAHISAYESGSRTPPLLEILAYARILHEKTGIVISADDLIDDARELPF